MVQDNVLAEAFGTLTALNDREETVKFSSLWQQQTAVLVFVRHFG